MNSWREPRAAEAVLRGVRAGTAATARFEVDLRDRPQVPDEVMDRLRAEAHGAGFAAGWTQGRAEAAAAALAAQAEVEHAAERFERRAERAVAALATAAGALEARVLPVVTEVEDAIVEIGLAVAEAVLGRELAIATDPGRDALARALDLAPTGRPVRARLNPDDLEILGADGSPRDIGGRSVVLLADPSLRTGEAVAECDTTFIDARIAPALDRVREVLGL